MDTAFLTVCPEFVKCFLRFNGRNSAPIIIFVPFSWKLVWYLYDVPIFFAKETYIVVLEEKVGWKVNTANHCVIAVCCCDEFHLKTWTMHKTYATSNAYECACVTKKQKKEFWIWITSAAVTTATTTPVRGG